MKIFRPGVAIAICVSAAACGAENSMEAFLTSPLDRFIGNSAWNNQEAFQRETELFTVNREELISQCMREAGFEYLPDLNSSRWTISSNVLNDHKVADREWVAQYGFGVVSGHRQDAIFSIWDEIEDPNQEYVASLTELERDAYFVALNGPLNNFPLELYSRGAWESWMNTRGCWGQSIVKAQTESILFLRQVDEFVPLFDAISELRSTVSDSSEFAEVMSDWSNCLADLGMGTFSNPPAASNAVISAFSNLQTEQETSLLNLRQMIRNGQLPKGTALQEAEIRLALADWDCREQTGYEYRMATIWHDAETQFVADHRTALEAYQAASQQR